MEGSEVLRESSSRTGRKADFGNSRVYESTFLSHGHLHLFHLLFFLAFFFFFSPPVRGAVEKMLITFTMSLSKQM